jgi:ribonuclease R
MPKTNKKSIPKTSHEESKKGKLFQNLLKVTQQLISGKNYSPLSEKELFHVLSLPDQHACIFRQVVDTLIEQSVIEEINNRFIFIKKIGEVITGVLRVHPRGFGFLQAEEPKKYPQDIFVPKHLTQTAVDGDKVEVLINPEAFSEKGPEGKVIKILSRGRTHIAGIIRFIEFDEIIAYVPLLGMQQRVIVRPHEEFQLRVGDRIIMEVIDWGSKSTETVCKASNYIGHISDPSCDIKAAIEEFEIRSEFPNKVVQEAEKLGKKVSLKDMKDREDFRHYEIFTIDPDTAKDFDDALHLTKGSDGHYELGVHIADVSHYVTIGSALDLEAKVRCNSTYFPGTCIPMLPSELSENLCSLRPNVNRLTVSIIIHFDQFGNELDFKIVRSIIKSAKRFTYKEAKLILDNKKASPHAPTLHLMVELCKLLKKKRYERGSIEFCMPELVVLVDEKGAPQKTDFISYDITHQLVEEFMLKANETVATHLAKKGKNLTYRVHDEPAEENMKDFSVLANAFGFELSPTPKPNELQKLFDESVDTSYAQYLATSYIRRMRLAMYSADNIGHYGLGLTHYCHFTSPIRRYVDLVVHRILFGEKDDKEKLDLIATECSDQERISAKAENNVVLLKKLRLLEKISKESPYKEYEAIVTKVKNFGFFFEVLELMLESFFHVSELENDYYVFDEANVKLHGTRYNQNYTSGDKITVLLRAVDLIGLESKWHLVGSEQIEGHKISRAKNFGKIAKRVPLKPKPKYIPKKLTKSKSSAKKGPLKKAKNKTSKKKK